MVRIRFPPAKSLQTHQFLSGGAHHCGRVKCRRGRKPRARHPCSAFYALVPVWMQGEASRARR